MKKCSNVLTKESCKFFLVHQVVHFKADSFTNNVKSEISIRYAICLSHLCLRRESRKNQAMYVSFKGNTATHIFLHVPFEASKILGGRGSPRNGGSACGPSKTIVPTDRRQLCILGGKQKKLNGVCMECQASVTLQD